MAGNTNIENNLPLLNNLAPKALPTKKERAVAVLQELLEQQTDNFDGQAFASIVKSHPDLEKLLLAIFGSSPYLTALITRHPAYLQAALNTPPDQHIKKLAEKLKAATRTATAESEVMQHLRRFKAEAALTIALADIGEYWGIDDVIRWVTFTADQALKAAVEFLFRQAAEKGDYLPYSQDNPTEKCGYIVLAMGKHGAHELNYSSDIDLIILFDKQRIRLSEHVEPRSYLVRLTQKLIKLMQEITADGYVFRMDLRLRPDPGATQIALSTEAAFAYYESFGQNWERAAMIKARPAAGDIAAGEAFLSDLAPYIWRKYLDFAAIDDIHAMKRQIHSFKGHGSIAILGHDLKLGRGGIREIEFFAQTQQLIAGGRQHDLRTRQTQETLRRLADHQWIKPDVCKELIEAYKFLRRLEHRIQMINDEQTHKLPSDQAGLEAIAHFSGFETAETFSNTLRKVLETVQHHYEDLFEDDPTLASNCGSLVFVGDTHDPGTVNTLSRLGFNNPGAAIDMIKAWHYGRYAATRTPRAREMLTKFQPILLEAIAKTSQPNRALATFDAFLKDLPAGVQLFSLLSSNPNLMRLIADIMGTAPSLARILARRTRLLDAVLDPTFFGELPDENELRHIIEDQFARCNDYQDTLDSARIIGQEQTFLTGVRLLSGIIDANQAANRYTRIAETVIAELQKKVTNELVEQHGSFEGMGVSILAMGKLGGREMTASSDLDLILIYDFGKGQIQSDGKKPLAPTQYFARLTQRLISALSAPTAEGELYEVDMRLRPSGRAGPVATHIESFMDYQHNQAWVWEHMALTRARPITGPIELQQKLRGTITDILAKERDPATLANNVNEMRQKIGEQKGTSDIWNLKQVRGGLVDLEFICQYLQLRDAHKVSTILATKTEDSLRAMTEAHILDPVIGTKLSEAAENYNTLMQMIRLCTADGFNPDNASDGLKTLLASSLELPSFSALKEYLDATTTEIKAIYHSLIEKN